MKSEDCRCKKPVLQKGTRKCGKCGIFIDRVLHIILNTLDNIKKDK